MRFQRHLPTVTILLIFTGMSASAQEKEEFALELTNPFAILSSLKLQGNYDHDIGPLEKGERYYLNIQALVPFALDDDWSLITRTDFVEFDQDKIFPGAGHQLGISDVAQSFFLSPVKRGPFGLVWGAGPVFLYPLASDRLLGSGKWGAGPTAGALVQQGAWTVGVILNHIWSFAGDRDRNDINGTFIQPFVSYTTADAWTVTINTQTTYDWNRAQWTIPITATVSKITGIGSQRVSPFVGLRYWADSPVAGAHHWGAFFGITFLFPKS